MPLLWGAAALLVGAFLGGPAWTAPAGLVPLVAGLVPLVAGLALYFRVGTVRRPPTDHPAFGRPVLAPADGVVVRATTASGTTAASCSPPACRSGWTASRSTAPSRPGDGQWATLHDQPPGDAPEGHR